MDKHSIKRILSIILAAAILMSVIVPTFAMLAGAEGTGDTTPAPTQTQEPQATSTPGPTPMPTPAPSGTVSVDDSKSVYISNYTVMDKNGSELTVINPGQKFMVAFNVVDNRITYVDKFNNDIRARLTQGTFTSNDATYVDCYIKDVGMSDGKKILGYSVVFRDVEYKGGQTDFSFDVSYPTNGSTPISVPYTLLKQTITQAVDSIPEPKVILNSANYGSGAIIGQNFTLSTVATNTSEYVSLENVSVGLELPVGMAMASGNSQVLIGKVDKKGTISQSFNLVVNGVENNVSSLPVKIIYEYEAYVQGGRKSYTTQQEVAINIEQEIKFEISKLDYMESINAGEENSISISLINKGKTTINNVTAEVESLKINGRQTTFVGNIQPGSENSADIYFTINEAGTATGKVIITYEDARGKTYTLEKEFSMEVMEPIINPDWNGGIDIPPEEPKKSNTPLIIGGVIALAAAAGVGVVVRKRKKAKLAEDEDEDI